MNRPLPQLSLKERRDRTIQALCEHFAQDRLELDEFEARLDAAHRAQQHDDLRALLRDLPAPGRASEAPAGPLAQAARALSDRDYADDMLKRGSRAVSAAVGDAVRDTRTLVAFMSGVERRGAWTPARKNLVVALMGGAELDFREVVMPAGITEVVVLCLMGGVEVIVPPDLAVDVNGVAIMGGFEHTSPRPAEPDAPMLRITGFCLMGGVEVRVRLPGETASEAKKRLRAERRIQGARRRLADGE
jgi:hypothetical protein